MPGDSSCSQWLEQSARGVVILHVSQGRALRSRNLIEKGLTYKKKSLRAERSKINSRLIRKHSTIEDLLFSSKDITAMEKEIKQFNDLFKMMLDVYQEYSQLLGKDERGRDDDCLIMLTLKYVPSRGRYIVALGKLLREPNHQSVHPRVTGVYLRRGV